MAQRDVRDRRARRRPTLRHTPFIAAALATVLLVPVGASSATSGSADAADEPLAHDRLGHADEHIERVGDLVLISDPAPIGPFPGQDALDDDLAAPAHAAPTMDHAFTLHSRPEATRKILLDFDGQLVDNPNWNGGAPIDAAPYSRGDQHDESFSASDLIEIEKIWARVAEDFAVWDVDVTTEDPGTQGLARNGSGDVEYGVRVVITPTYEWYSTQRFGGVAYLNTFDRFEDLPAWVFSGNLGNGNAKSVAEAVSHEVGHTLGLSHDGVTTTDAGGNTTTSAYYSGHGNWAPIMGVSYYKDVTQWAKGEYPGATTTQDDLAIIDGYLPRLAPDGEQATAASTIGPGSSTTLHTLALGGDVAEHVIEVEDGPVTVSVAKAHPTGNLLAELEVRAPNGQIVASAQPSDPAAWSLDVTLPAGTPAGLYTVEVSSVGWAPPGDPGFTSYASMGSYLLDIDAPQPFGDDPTPPPPPAGSGDRLTAISPRRVLDTRTSGSALVGPLSPDVETPVVIGHVPADASAVVVNVTAVAPRSAGFFSLSPCGGSEGDRTSSLNFSAGRNVANSVIVPVSASAPDQVCIFSSVAAHALLDLTGWIGDSGDLSLGGLEAMRVVDTRDGTGIDTRLVAGTRTPVALASVLQGHESRAVAINVTAIRPSTSGFLTIDDCTGSSQSTSSLNFDAGEVRGNNGVFALGDGQRLCVTSSSATHLTIDVTGEFGTGDGLTFVASAAPERVLDTRSSNRVEAGGTTTFGVETAAGANTLERSPVAASINLTATRHGDDGFVTAWACGDRPQTSALNPSAGSNTANGALVELSSNGTSCLFHASGGHLIVDLAGWWI